VESFLIGAAEFSWTSLESWIAIVKMVIGFGFIIFVHELGHFLVAKACGVKCEKFYVGFDAFDVKIGDLVLIPRRLFHFKWGETEYGIGIIPLGGYVKMLGQDDNPANQAAERERTLVKEGDADAPTESTSPAEASGDRDEPPQLDPRSYPAKSVPQRLAIISAGVIMNLIFAVIFAAIAYGMGAPYQPAVIGGVTPGGPAWRADIHPGTRILQINDDAKNPDHLRWQDVAGGIALTGVGHEVRLKVTTPESEAPSTVTLVPEGHLLKLKLASLGTVGIEAASANRLAAGPRALFPGMAASKANPPLKPGDTITAVQGRATPYGHDIKREFLVEWDRPVTLSIERVDDAGKVERLESTVEPQPLLDYGVRVGAGPIAAIQSGSPADAAGLQVGDRIVAVDGGPVGDPMLLPERMRRIARDGGTVALTIERGEPVQSLVVSVAPRSPRYLLDVSAHLPMGVDELGITLAVTATIDEVVAGSAAAEAGLQVGDVIESVRFLENDAPIDPKSEAPFPLDPITVAEYPHVWSFVMHLTQFAAPEHALEVTAKRGSETVRGTMAPRPVDGEFARSRGISLQPYQLTLTAKRFDEAIALGLRETKEDASQVYLTLRQMLLGRVSAINLRGPGTIASGAVQMALEGDAVLLLFLALISANLAVVNFLPIPVLDGGHAVFLLYEGIFRKPPPEHMVFWLSMGGLAFLLLLMAFVLTMDFLQVFVG